MRVWYLFMPSRFGELLLMLMTQFVRPVTSISVRNNISRTYAEPYPILSSGSGPIIKMEKLWPTMYATEKRWTVLEIVESTGPKSTFLLTIASCGFASYI